MRAIFISYRRNDAEGEAGRLFDDLVREFGDQSVFMDVSTIEAGRDFRKAIDESVATCGALLSIIGVSWVDSKSETGQRRLDDPSDFVRLETASALKRDIPVIPVLVRGARMPTAGQLPDDLKDLAYRNAVELTHARWNSDVQLLIGTLRPIVGASPAAPLRKEAGNGGAKPRRPLLIGAAGVVVAALIGYFMISGKSASVPDLTGKTLPEAAALLGAAHLSVGNTRTQDDTTKEPDTVMSQSPAASASVKQGSKVDLVLSSRPAAAPQLKNNEPAPATSKPVVPGGDVLIANVNSSLCLSPAGGATDRNVEVVQYRCDRDPARVWRFVEVEDNIVQIRNSHSGLCLTVAGGNTNLNDPAVQYFCDNDRSRSWRYSPVNDTTFRLVNVNSGLCLTIAGGGSAENTTAAQFRCDGDPSRDWTISPPR
jgi:hypothetical protein